METIKTNTDALQRRINSEVHRAFSECQNAANDGKSYIFFKTDRDIQMDVRIMLEKNHRIYVPSIISRYEMSRLNIEHHKDTTEMKLKWYD
jgi:5-formyltetrahydrofolate cyclo-ligase